MKFFRILIKFIEFFEDETTKGKGKLGDCEQNQNSKSLINSKDKFCHSQTIY